MRSQRHRFLRSRGSRFLPACLNVLAAAVASATGCAATAPPAGQRELMIVANDNKQSWDAAGKVLLAAPGQDTLYILDIVTDPLAPRIIASVMLPNEVAGPPVNLAITPDQTLAIMANSLNVVSDNDVLKQVRTYECTNGAKSCKTTQCKLLFDIARPLRLSNARQGYDHRERLHYRPI